MSSSQAYPPISGAFNPDQLRGDATAIVVSDDWYATSSYAYDEPYITPYPSSTEENQTWHQYARASITDMSMSPYGLGLQTQLAPAHSTPCCAARPRSSPSTFKFDVDSTPWPTSSGLGLQNSNATGQPTPVTSTFSQTVFQSYPSEEFCLTSRSPEIMHPQPLRPYVSIAPNPESVAAITGRRKREDEQVEVTSSPNKRRKRTSPVASADLSEDDRFLVQLKEDEVLPWKDIATRFQTDKGKNFQVAALQMRYKRLREKFRVWEDQDLQALKLAHEYWEKYKWEIISGKMLDFGPRERWPARHCARKWPEIENLATPQGMTSGFTPAPTTQFSSPVEGPVHFAFMPLQ